MTQILLAPTRKSQGEEMFAMHCRIYGLEPLREFVFSERKWRFDFAWPQLKIAVEIEGGTKTQGRHTRHEGFENDCNKYNAAQRLGWRVFRYTPGMVRSAAAIDEMRELIDQELK